MSEFLEDPSVLTKEKLKTELLANNVALPSGDHRKDVYVQLYLTTLTPQNKEKSLAIDSFSSDEDLPPAVVKNSNRSGKKAVRKTDKPQPDCMSIADQPDQSLKEQLETNAINTGPVVASTVAGTTLNGNADSDQYSDKEEEERVVPGLQSVPVEETEPLPVVKRPVGSGGKSLVHSETSQHRDHDQVERETAGDETPGMNKEGVLQELFINKARSPTGISATSRRPIRGAAGRPLKESDFWLNESLLFQRRNLTERGTFHAESHDLSPGASSIARKCELPFLPLWKQLLFLSTVAGVLIFIYQTMETSKLSPSGPSPSP